MKYKVTSRVQGGGFFGIGATDIQGVDFIEATSEQEAAENIYKKLRTALVLEDLEDDYAVSILSVEESK